MSGLKTTEAESGPMFGPVRLAVRYCELVLPDGVTVHGPVTVELAPYWVLIQAGSLSAGTA